LKKKSKSPSKTGGIKGDAVVKGRGGAQGVLGLRKRTQEVIGPDGIPGKKIKWGEEKKRGYSCRSNEKKGPLVEPSGKEREGGELHMEEERLRKGISRDLAVSKNREGGSKDRSTEGKGFREEKKKTKNKGSKKDPLETKDI